MTAYMKNVFAIIYGHEILSVRRVLSAENLTLEKWIMKVPVNISQAFFCCSVDLAFLF